MRRPRRSLPPLGVAVAAALLALVATPSSVSAAGDGVKWTNQFGTDGDESVASVGTSRFSEVYLAGTTDGAFAGTKNAGDLDGFVAKLDKYGNRRWTRLLGSTGQDDVRALAVGYHGDVFVVGSTDGKLGSTPNSGGEDAFLARYDRNGKRLWVRQFGTEADEIAWGVTSSPATGAVYVVGTTTGAFPNTTPGGATDGFVARFDRYGNRRWLTQFGTADVDEFGAYGVAVSSKDEVYVAGDTFGAFAGHDNAGGRDPVLAKFTSKGALVWTAQFGTAADDEGAYGVAVARSGEVYVAGTTNGVMAAGDGLGDYDGFLARYDNAGTQQWIRQFGTTAADYAWPVVVSPSGFVYVTGYTEGGFPGTPNAGGLDAFVAKYSSAGAFIKTRTIGTPGDDSDVVTNVHLALLPSGALVVASSTDDVLPGKLSAGGADAFVIALSTL